MLKPTAALAPSLLTLMPGELICERQPRRVSTILGSCVALCLWDKRLRFGGMNHFILPHRPSNEPESLRFGNVAIPALISRMSELGSHPRDLQAKLFGGACVLATRAAEFSVGRRNVELAVSELRRHRIPIISGRLAGNEGIVVVQCTACGEVRMRTIASSGGRENRHRQVMDLCLLSGSIDFSQLDGDHPQGSLVVRSRTFSPSVAACPLCASVPTARKPEWA